MSASGIVGIVHGASGGSMDRRRRTIGYHVDSSRLQEEEVIARMCMWMTNLVNVSARCWSAAGTGKRECAGRYSCAKESERRESISGDWGTQCSSMRPVEKWLITPWTHFGITVSVPAGPGFLVGRGIPNTPRGSWRERWIRFRRLSECVVEAFSGESEREEVWRFEEPGWDKVLTFVAYNPAAFSVGSDARLTGGTPCDPPSYGAPVQPESVWGSPKGDAGVVHGARVGLDGSPWLPADSAAYEPERSLSGNRIERDGAPCVGRLKFGREGESENCCRWGK